MGLHCDSSTGVDSVSKSTGCGDAQVGVAAFGSSVRSKNGIGNGSMLLLWLDHAMACIWSSSTDGCSLYPVRGLDLQALRSWKLMATRCCKDSTQDVYMASRLQFCEPLGRLCGLDGAAAIRRYHP
jgi:hypothetical protein